MFDKLLSDFNLKFSYKDILCNSCYVVFIVVLIFFVTFAIKTHKRYVKFTKIIGDVNNIEGFTNMGKDSKKELIEELDIDIDDINIVKKQNDIAAASSGEKIAEKSKDKMIIMPNKIINIPHDKIYDEFYASVYDKVTLDQSKIAFEAGYIKSLMDKQKTDNKILDVGCGTGQHIKYLSQKTDYVGLDRSNPMLVKAKLNTNGNCRLVSGDANQLSIVGEDEYSHIICLYFTIYYFKDPDRLFYNFSKWLKDDGIVVVHLVDRDKFDPVLDPANPSRINSIQKYTDKRITSSIINFNNITYISDFVLKKNNMAEFQEIIRFKKNDIERRQRHLMYMYTNKKYVQIAKKNGFELQEIKSMNKIKYEHNFLFTFKKVKKTE